MHPTQHPHSQKGSLLVDVERIAFVSVHNGKGERRAIVRSVSVAYGELKNTRAFWSILLWDGKDACFS